jgi:guanylate kinase
MPKTGKLFVMAAPSGAGKTTLVKAMVERNPELKFSVSYTTRPKRFNEVHGVDYFFVARDEFLDLREQGELLESALVFDNHYGTSRSQVEQHLAAGDDVILEIDWQGARQVKASMPDSASIFIMPPSRGELERRLRDRKTDSDQVIRRRLRDALCDMQHWSEFDYVIVNDELATASDELAAVFAGRGEANQSDNEALKKRVRAICEGE